MRSKLAASGVRARLLTVGGGWRSCAPRVRSWGPLRRSVSPWGAIIWCAVPLGRSVSAVGSWPTQHIWPRRCGRGARSPWSRGRMTTARSAKRFGTRSGGLTFGGFAPTGPLHWSRRLLSSAVMTTGARLKPERAAAVIGRAMARPRRATRQPSRVWGRAPAAPRLPSCSRTGCMQWPLSAGSPSAFGAEDRQGTTGRRASGELKLARKWWRRLRCQQGSEPLWLRVGPRRVMGRGRVGAKSVGTNCGQA